MADMTELVWEKVLSKEVFEGKPTTSSEFIKRAQVPNGWLVKAETKGCIAITFFPDPDYTWK